jgi:hypothetical protein
MSAPGSMPARLDQAVRALRTLRKTGQIGESDFFKGMVQIAHAWLVLGNKEQASNLVGGLSPEFVENDLPALMAADPDFMALAVELGTAVGGDADEGEAEAEMALLTQKPASA